MRKLRTAVLAGIATLGVAGTAMAASNDTHVMAVGLPDGSVARIEYQGAVAPKVRIDPSAPALRIVPVRLADPFDAAPFAMIDQIMADMDRQAAAMAAALQPVPADKAGRPDLAAFGNLPAGTISYRFVSASDGNRVCSRSWQVTSQGPQQAPKLISASSGDCAGDGNSPAGTAGAAAAKTVAAGNGAAAKPHDATPTI
jgi:hypothetical protein